MVLDIFESLVIGTSFFWLFYIGINAYRSYKKTIADPSYKQFKKEQEDYEERTKLYEERSKEPPVLPKGYNQNTKTQGSQS